MDRNELHQRIQDHFTDGLVTIVGSGLSVAEGVPGMAALGKHLVAEIPTRIGKNVEDEWTAIAAQLDAKVDLESVLLAHPPPAALEEKIGAITADLILGAESNIMAEVIAGDRQLRLTRLLEHMLKPNTGIPVITTNYDRLIELAAEMAGLGVDTLFLGQHFGKLSPKESAMSFCRGTRQHRRTVHLMFSKRMTLLKPHGSLDWFRHGDGPIRCPMPLDLPRLIITPGLNKLAAGYESPFDSHRERANKEIDSAARFLIIGYGFNDNHLETHLSNQLRKDVPALVLTRGLTDNVKRLIVECSGIMALSAGENSDETGALLTTAANAVFFPGPDLWDVNVLVDEVLQP